MPDHQLRDWIQRIENYHQNAVNQVKNAGERDRAANELELVREQHKHYLALKANAPVNLIASRSRFIPVEVTGVDEPIRYRLESLPSIMLKWESTGSCKLLASCTITLESGAEDNVERTIRRGSTNLVKVATAIYRDREAAFLDEGRVCWVTVWEGTSCFAFLDIRKLEDEVAMPRLRRTRAELGLPVETARELTYGVQYRFRVLSVGSLSFCEGEGTVWVSMKTKANGGLPIYDRIL